TANWSAPLQDRAVTVARSPARGRKACRDTDDSPYTTRPTRTRPASAAPVRTATRVPSRETRRWATGVSASSGACTPTGSAPSAPVRCRAGPPGALRGGVAGFGVVGEVLLLPGAGHLVGQVLQDPQVAVAVPGQRGVVAAVEHGRVAAPLGDGGHPDRAVVRRDARHPLLVEGDRVLLQQDVPLSRRARDQLLLLVDVERPQLAVPHEVGARRPGHPGRVDRVPLLAAGLEHAVLDAGQLHLLAADAQGELLDLGELLEGPHELGAHLEAPPGVVVRGRGVQ